ncbi:MAG: response regulator transcription factor [Chitinophagaceae bacterium]
MIRIAIADNHQQVREIWKRVLSANTDLHVVCICTNGQEAIDMAATHMPDIFLMDINMERINGIDATAIITNIYPGIKVIGMSIYLDDYYVNSMLAAGANGYINKNSDYQEMIEAIHQVYEGNRYICNAVKQTEKKSIAI